MGRPIIFLDIDGVLNDHTYDDDSDSCTMERPLVKRLNFIIRETDARLVISSAWRYNVIMEVMTVKGFENMLRAFGVRAQNRVIGITREDSPDDWDDRGAQISDWIKDNEVMERGENYVVIDDLDCGIRKSGHPFVHTDGNKGLQPLDVVKAVRLLIGKDTYDQCNTTTDGSWLDPLSELDPA